MSRIEKALEKAAKIREETKETEPYVSTIANAGTTDICPDVFKPKESLQIDSPYIVTATQPDSPVSEEYRKLKSLIVKLTKSDKFLNTLMVTSTVKGEGKTITALNLAITLAQEYDHAVLLVDADLRQPSLNKYLGDFKLGLTDCLMNGVDICDALVKTGIGKLVYLPSGKQVSDPSELLSSNRMHELITELKNRYADRYVIFDTPPVLSFAETHSLSTFMDGILLVVSEGTTSLNNIKEALNMLKNTKLFGIVYNNVEIDRFDDYRYYNYYKSYYSKKDGKEGKDDGRKGLYGWMRSIKGKKNQKDS